MEGRKQRRKPRGQKKREKEKRKKKKNIAKVTLKTSSGASRPLTFIGGCFSKSIMWLDSWYVSLSTRICPFAWIGPYQQTGFQQTGKGFDLAHTAGTRKGGKRH
eukprot:2061227-Rhodomonas_salina.3